MYMSIYTPEDTAIRFVKTAESPVVLNDKVYIYICYTQTSNLCYIEPGTSTTGKNPSQNMLLCYQHLGAASPHTSARHGIL